MQRWRERQVKRVLGQRRGHRVKALTTLTKLVDGRAVHQPHQLTVRGVLLLGWLLLLLFLLMRLLLLLRGLMLRELE